MPQLNLLVPWESCDWILPPWQQTSYIMGKSQKPNHRLLRGLVEESHLCCNVENREWLCPGRYACACSFIHATGFYQAARQSGTNSVPGFQLCNLQVGWCSLANLGMVILPRDLLCGPNGKSACEGTCSCEAGVGKCWWMWLFLNGEIVFESLLCTEHYARCLGDLQGGVPEQSLMFTIWRRG